MKTNSDTTPELYIGLDVHKEKTSVAVADPGAQGEIRSHGEVATTQRRSGGTRYRERQSDSE
jgi:hypothetical protein